MPARPKWAAPFRQTRGSGAVASRRTIWLAVAGLVGAIFVAYHNSFSGPFVFDDGPGILGNPSIRHLSELGDVLSPPTDRGQTVGGRPLVNLSLAINYALGGTEVRGYHVFNLLVHLCGALAVFGIARRTLRRPVLIERFGVVAVPLAFAIALLWAVHPLLTEAVTYTIQRAESLMGLFYLLTLYGFIRAQESDGNSRLGANAWLGLSLAACWSGMATKEVMVSAPLLVLLYDRTFVAGSWRGAWTERKGYYLGLGAAWLLLAWLVLGAENRGGTAGLGLRDSVWTYALTQSRAILIYLRLAFWPRPLVFDYGTDTIGHFVDALPFALTVVGLLAVGVVALRRWPAVGFLAAWFFAILAPSSSVVPIPVQTMAEHRMYLPLVAVVAGAVVGLYALWRRGCWWIFAGAAATCVGLTVARNDDFRSATSIWADTVAKRPANARAHCYYADVLAGERRFDEALAQYDEAIRLDRLELKWSDRSIFGDILVNSGNVLRTLGRAAEAEKRYAEALELDPTLAAAHFNLGALALQANRLSDAAERFERALKIDPNYTAAHTSLGSALLLQGRTAEALSHYERALRLDPSAKSHRDFGIALLYARRLPEAVTQLEAAVRLEPDFAPAHEFLGNALAAQNRPTDAAVQYRRALEIEPANERARRALESLPAAGR